MKRKVIIQPQVLNDLRDIAAYYRGRDDNTDVAAWLDGLMTSIEDLVDDAERYPRVSDSRPSRSEVRYKLYGTRSDQHRIVFQLRAGGVRVLTVRHCARAPLTERELGMLTSDGD